MKYKNFKEDDIEEFEAMSNDMLDAFLRISTSDLHFLKDSAQEFFKEQAEIITNILESRK